MFSRKIFLTFSYLFFSIILLISYDSKGDSKPVTNNTIEDLNLQYNRGTKYWTDGNGRLAFASLDSLRKISLSTENAEIKSKAMLFLAKCFYSQKNYGYAINYLNYALDFGGYSNNTDALLEIYELQISSHHETKNLNQEAYFSQLKKAINDSLETVKMKNQVDSLKQIVEAQKEKQKKSEEKKTAEENNTSIIETINSTNSIFIILFGLILSGLIIYFIVRNRNSNTSFTKENRDIPKIDSPSSKSINTLIEKIAKVELVFIRAEVLGEFGNKKTVIKIINDYNEQLPLIIKNLDDAITTNDNEPIINALSYLKPYLTAFGMSATLAMLNEVESEAPTQKTTKLLSRVFQIRNHIRRAHDETKALIEVLG